MIENYKVGDKVKISADIPTIDGMLHENEIVKIDGVGFPDRDLRVKDSLGKIWYINFCDVIPID
tara:strand:+ start:5751 stop:5942 length:192 start_codon:yes stop_codon:yes gene_type:complete